jgi:integrase
MRRKKIFIRPALRSRKGDLSKKWYVELSQRNPATGEMARKRFETLDDVSINDFSTAEDRTHFAEKIIEKLNRQLSNGWTFFSDASRCVYEDQLQYAHEAAVYKKHVEANKSYTYWASRFIAEELQNSDVQQDTVEDYQSKYRVFGLWLASKNRSTLDISCIDQPILVEFFTYLKNDRNIAARTYRGYIDMLARLFDFVRRSKGIVENPVHTLPPNHNMKDMGAERIRSADLEKIMQEMYRKDRQLALACQFEYYCGMRPGKEIRLLKVGDIDFRRGYSKVRVTVENAKTSRRREVILPDVFLDCLLSEWRLNTYDRNMYVFGKNGQPGYERLGKNNMRNRFARIRAVLDMPTEYKYYSMKHTGATVLAEMGEPIINIRDHLGHTSIQTTEHYLKRHGVNETRHIRSNFPKI